MEAKEKGRLSMGFEQEEDVLLFTVRHCLPERVLKQHILWLSNIFAAACVLTMFDSEDKWRADGCKDVKF